MEKLHKKEMEWLHENLTLVASPLEIPILKNTGFGTGGQKLRPAVLRFPPRISFIHSASRPMSSLAKAGEAIHPEYLMGSFYSRYNKK